MLRNVRENDALQRPFSPEHPVAEMMQISIRSALVMLFNFPIDFSLRLLCCIRPGTREVVCPGYKCNRKMLRKPLDHYCQDTHSYIPPGNYQAEYHIDICL